MSQPPRPLDRGGQTGQSAPVPQQLKVLELIARGLPYADIARRMNVPEDTLHTHRKRAAEAYAKVADERMEGTGQLVYRAVTDGHIDSRPDPREGTDP